MLRITNPYSKKTKLQYKVSLHNHSQFMPTYDHAPVPTDVRLTDYRDYNTDPPYGAVAITEHNRITTPWNTNPPADKGVNAVGLFDPPWGVNGILWIPGNERVFGLTSKERKLYGEMLLIGVSTEEVEGNTWGKLNTSSARNMWEYYSYDFNPVSAELTFSGVGVSWVARKRVRGGIGEVYIDGVKVGEVDFYSATDQFQQEIYTVAGLTDTEHTIKIVKLSGLEISLDTIIVTKGDASTDEYGASNPVIKYQPKPYLHNLGYPIEDAMAMYIDAGVFVAMAHPNARLETSGEYAGKQIWTTAGYTYEELDLIFGNISKTVKPMAHLPHALEIGNAPYDFGATTNYTNAEDKWDYVLSQGHKLLGIASDDSHGATPYRGWCVANVSKPRDELTVDDVLECLLSGNYYSSQGPKIDIDVIGRIFKVSTNTPSTIEFISQGKVIYKAENATELSYLLKGYEGYVRARVTQENESWEEIAGGIGKKRLAWTNPIYTTGRSGTLEEFNDESSTVYPRLTPSL